MDWISSYARISLSWQKKAAQASLRGLVFIDAGAKA
jgi:hypothetical protein